MNDHTVPQLPPRSQCTGCAACAEGCPKNAIHMLPDREGFLYPTVTDACIQCGHCTHICPVLRQREAHPEPAVFAAWNPDNAVRQNSTCGGVFSLLADYVLEGGGVVFGAGMDAQLRVRHEAVKRKEDLPRIRGAKPVQSDVTGIYQQVRRELDRGRPVLFSGTPCQVDGLYHYLGEHPEKLLTCDVLCRGVCSPGVWAKLVQSMAYIKRKQPVAVQFCGKLPGQRERRFQVRFDDGTTFDSPLSKSEFGRGFFGNLFLRPACHTCPYASVDRPGDLSLGAFYGLPKDAYPQEQRSGVSSLVNTPLAPMCSIRPLKLSAALSEAVTGDPFLPGEAGAQRASSSMLRPASPSSRSATLSGGQLLSGEEAVRKARQRSETLLFTVIKERLWKKH
ncbi:MAG: Coenzyme F420 hydrogenase/dehydrogenase, beta subunit C-terminal domain [Oscillospiraceae bacterium]